MSNDKPGMSPGGLHDALTRLAAAAIALVRTRAEIAAIDFEEAGARAKSRVALLVVALLCFAVGTLSATGFVIVYFWDTYRLTAIGVVTIAYFLAGALALWRFNVRQDMDPSPFASTIAELERDWEWLTRKMERKE